MTEGRLAILGMGLLLAAFVSAAPQAAERNQAVLTPVVFAPVLFAPGGLAAAEPARVPIDGLGRVAAVLAPADVIRYRRIFSLQERGLWNAADAEIAALKDPLLIGHVTAQRLLHPTAYQAGYGELAAWLERYADHPQAQRIFDLAKKRRPAGAPHLRAPQGHAPPRAASAAAVAHEPPGLDGLSGRQRGAAVRLKRDVRARILRGWPTGAKALLEDARATELLSGAEIGELFGEIARGYFRADKDSEAQRSAELGSAFARDDAPLANWWGGLAAYRAGDGAAAERLFGLLAVSRTAPEWNAAAGAYWAARSALVDRRPQEMSRWLALAARHPFTFYGLLARRALGVEIDFDWSLPPLAGDLLADMRATASGARGFALLQLGRVADAEAEFARVAATNDDLMPAVLALASRTAMPGLARRLAGAGDAAPPLVSAMYPVPEWRPDGGFTIDRALLFAIVRQESGFRPRAKSRAGARGLMQLMPATASFIGRDQSLRGYGGYQLFDAGFNLALGQRYVRLLLDDPAVAGDLFRAAAAYNAGPGTLRKWLAEISYRDDPLLFVASLPSVETRKFVERVLTAFWIYRHRLGQPTPSLTAAAAGGWAVFRSLDGSGAAEYFTVVERDGYVAR